MEQEDPTDAPWYSARHGKDRRRLGQPAGAVPEQQPEAGRRQVLQLPGAEEAAGHRDHPDGALQRHRRLRRSKIPPHLNIERTERTFCLQHYILF